MRLGKIEHTTTGRPAGLILMLIIAGCGPQYVTPKYITPKYITSDTAKIAPNYGVMIAIFDSDQPLTISIKNEDSPDSVSQALKLEQGRNPKMISMPAGNYSWEIICVRDQCPRFVDIFRRHLMFRIEEQAINYIGNAIIATDARGYSLSVWDYNDEATQFLESYPQLKGAHPFVRNVATGSALGGHLHLDVRK